MSGDRNLNSPSDDDEEEEEGGEEGQESVDVSTPQGTSPTLLPIQIPQHLSQSQHEDVNSFQPPSRPMPMRHYSTSHSQIESPTHGFSEPPLFSLPSLQDPS